MFDILSSIFGIADKIQSRIPRKQLHIDFALQYVSINYDYFMALGDTSTDVSIGFKMAGLPKGNPTSARLALKVVVINVSPIPIVIKSIQCTGRRAKDVIPVEKIAHSNLPAHLEPHVGEVTAQFLLDEIWAVYMITQHRLTNDLAPLLHYTDLDNSIKRIKIELSNGKTTHETIPDEIRDQISKYVNRPPELSSRYDGQNLRCAVEGCDLRPDYIVLLFDQYNNGGVVLKQDSKCPFLCEKHMQENERGIGNEGSGERRYPRDGSGYYPYSLQNGGQGFTKYYPIKHNRRSESLWKRLLKRFREKSNILSARDTGRGYGNSKAADS